MADSSETDSASLVAALVCTVLISLAPNLILFLFPNCGSDSAWLSIGQAVAAGGLLGDVFLHTLPHAFLHDVERHGPSFIGLVVLAGFATFFVTDVIVRSAHHFYHHHNDTVGGSDGGMNGSAKDEDSCVTHNSGALHGKLSSMVVLNLAADSLHNFTDGLAIGVSFAASSGSFLTTGDESLMSAVSSRLRSRGGLATLSVMFHEIPHELGDFAILLSHGFSKRKAILAQFGTAVAALCGTVAGVVATNAASGRWAEQIMLPFTAGGFLYLAGCNIIPEILVGTAHWKLRLLQVACFGMGVGFMYTVSLLEVHDHHSGSLDHGHFHANPLSHENHHRRQEL